MSYGIFAITRKGINMRLNKHEQEWIRLIAVERLSVIKEQIKNTENAEDREWMVNRAMDEVETLEKIIEKIG